MELAGTTLALMALAGFGAGWIDAVVGGGGLIQLPALLLGVPGATPAQLLATNKLGSICGTSISSVTYYRRVRPDLRTALPMAAVAFVGAVLGALIGLHIPKSTFNPIILVLLVVVGAYTLAKPDLGSVTMLRFAGHRHTVMAMLCGFLIGIYDGALGPGTGSFLVFALVGLMGYAFLEASAKAKIANVATNLGALVVFLPGGHVMWAVGLVLAVANPVGAYVGARTAVRFGSGFVRVVFVLVVTAFIVMMGAYLVLLCCRRRPSLYTWFGSHEDYTAGAPGVAAPLSRWSLPVAHSREEQPDVVGDDLGQLERREVAAPVELAPVHDAAVVPLGEHPDGLEVVREHRHPGRSRIDRRFGPGVRLLVVVSPRRGRSVREPVQRNLGQDLVPRHEARPVPERVEQLAPGQLPDR